MTDSIEQLVERFQIAVANYQQAVDENADSELLPRLNAVASAKHALLARATPKDEARPTAGHPTDPESPVVMRVAKAVTGAWCVWRGVRTRDEAGNLAGIEWSMIGFNVEVVPDEAAPTVTDANAECALCEAGDVASGNGYHSIYTHTDARGYKRYRGERCAKTTGRQDMSESERKND